MTDTDSDDPVMAALNEALDEVDGDETNYHIRQAMQHRLAVLDGHQHEIQETESPAAWLWATNRGIDAGAQKHPEVIGFDTVRGSHKLVEPSGDAEAFIESDLRYLIDHETDEDETELEVEWR